MRLEVLWEPWHCQGMEHLRLNVDRDGVFAESQVRDHQAGFEIRYVVRADARWRTRAVEVTRIDAHHVLRLRSDGEGHWEGHPELEGCRDVDLRCTPFTNSLPIHRQPAGGPAAVPPPPHLAPDPPPAGRRPGPGVLDRPGARGPAARAALHATGRAPL